MYRLFLTALAMLLATAVSADDSRALQDRLQKLESLMENASEYQNYLLLDTAARTAFDLDEYNRAHDYAERLLQLSARYTDDWNYGNAVHHGHIILGKIAFIIEDIPTAKRQLLAAGSSPGSDAIRKFGPDLELASDLLQKGETGSVIRYLELCRKLWPEGEARLTRWIGEIRDGKKPALLNDGTDRE